MGTLNTNTLLKVGKLKQLTKTMDKFNIKILAIQETRFSDENHFNSENYRIYKGKPAITIPGRNLKLFGTGFVVHKSILDSVMDFTSKSERISTLTIRSGNKAYTLVNAHAPTNNYNRKNPQMIEEFWEDLEETTSKIHMKHVKVLLGDFNAQLGRERKFRDTTGKYTAHKRTNKNGENLINFCRNFDLKIMSTQFQKPHNKLRTWKSPNNALGEFQIDHIAISKKNVREIMNVRTRKGFFESDHHLLQIKAKFIPNRQIKGTNRTFRTDPEYLQLNKKEITEKIKKIESNDWTELSGKMKEVLKLGQPPRKRKHRWWNMACDRAMEDRIQAWRKFNSHRTPEKWEEFKKIQKASSKIIRREKRGYENKRLKEIEEDFNKNNTRNFYRTFRESMTGYQPPSLCFKRQDGTLETNPKKNCEILAQYFDTLLNCTKPTQKLQFKKPEPNLDSKPPTKEEIVNIIKSLRNNRAPGEDELISEIWKLDHENITPKIHRIIEKIWETEKIPEEWKSALIHPLHKKGDKTDPNNYRGISLLPVTYKILSKALLNRLEPQIDPQIGEYQGGFRKGRSCSEQIWCLKTILTTRKTGNTTVTFVDFKKAYDSIDRETLFNTLEEMKVDNKTRNLIQETLTNTTSKVKFMGEVSEPFEIKTGVRQGDGLSPILFNSVLEKIIRTWEKGVSGVKMGRHKDRTVNIKCLAFADDIAIITKNRQEAKEALETLHEISAKAGLQISYEKTQYMDTKSTDRHPLVTKYGKITQVENFKYLGETIQKTGLNTKSNEERITKLQKAYRLTWNHYNKRCISINAKLRHYNTVVLPEALYASETTVIKGRTKIKEIEKQERKILRKIYGPVQKEGIWIKRPTRELYEQIETITNNIRKRRARFYGHIHRMNEDRLTKKIFNIATTNTVKINWVQETLEDLKSLNISTEDMTDREKYREKIRKQKFEQIPKEKKTGKKWTEERKKKHSEYMRDYWEERRKRQKK